MHPTVMDFSSEFEIPVGPSQIIDSDSENSNNGREDIYGAGERSPIIRRIRPLNCRPPGSPIFASKRKSVAPEPVIPLKTKPVRRALEVDFHETESLDENENVDISSFDENEITCNKPDDSSQQVSSCGSSIGRSPQPVSSLLSTSTFLADMEEEDQDTDKSISLLDSGRKRRHVRFGFAEQMAKLIQRKKSHDILENYQNKQNGEGPQNWQKFEIVEVQNFGNIYFIYGEKEVLAINSTFCSGTPTVGETVRFSSSKTSSLQKGERTIWFGVTNVSLHPAEAQQESSSRKEVTELTKSIALNCPCRDGALSTCLKVLSDFQLEMFKMSQETSLAEDSCSGGSQDSQSQEELNTTVANAVEKLGGFSSSPRSLLRTLKLQLEVIVHRVFFRSKVREDETEVGDLKFQISLLCEDLKGDFCLMRLSAEMEEDDHWRVLFRDNWEYFQGCRVTIMSPFLVQDRQTRSQNSQLFDVIRSIRETNQRICYVFTCFPGAKYRMEETAVISVSSQSTVGDSELQRRVNWPVKVIVFSPEDRVLHVVRDTQPGVVRLEVRKSLFIDRLLFTSGRFSFSCTVLGICVDSSGFFFMDYFSSIVNKCPVSVDISQLGLSPLRPSSEAGELVRVEGPVVSVDQEASVQWQECSRCHSEDVQETEDGSSCSDCGHQTTRTMIELVCDVGQPGATVRLSHSATSILPQPNISHLARFHPTDVLGRLVPTILCVVGTDSVAREC